MFFTVSADLYQFLLKQRGLEIKQAKQRLKQRLEYYAHVAMGILGVFFWPIVFIIIAIVLLMSGRIRI